MAKMAIFANYSRVGQALPADLRDIDVKHLRIQLNDIDATCFTMHKQ